jgi:hypothetical protein
LAGSHLTPIGLRQAKAICAQQNTGRRDLWQEYFDHGAPPASSRSSLFRCVDYRSR